MPSTVSNLSLSLSLRGAGARSRRSCRRRCGAGCSGDWTRVTGRCAGSSATVHSRRAFASVFSGPHARFPFPTLSCAVKRTSQAFCFSVTSADLESSLSLSFFAGCGSELTGLSAIARRGLFTDLWRVRSLRGRTRELFAVFRRMCGCRSFSEHPSPRAKLAGDGESRDLRRESRRTPSAAVARAGRQHHPQQLAPVRALAAARARAQAARDLRDRAARATRAPQLRDEAHRAREPPRPLSRVVFFFFFFFFFFEAAVDCCRKTAAHRRGRGAAASLRSIRSLGGDAQRIL